MDDWNRNTRPSSIITANMFQIGNGGRLRISNGNNDYTLIGTIVQTKQMMLVLSGHERLSSTPGSIEYMTATSTGAHKIMLIILRC